MFNPAFKTSINNRGFTYIISIYTPGLVFQVSYTRTSNKGHLRHTLYFNTLALVLKMGFENHTEGIM